MVISLFSRDMLDFLQTDLGITLTLGSVLLFVFHALLGDWVVKTIRTTFSIKVPEKKMKAGLFGVEVLLFAMTLLYMYQTQVNEPVTSQNIVNIPPERAPTETELQLETMKEAVNEIKVLTENRRKLKDSIKSEKPKKFVYQIGGIKGGRDIVLDHYMRIKTINELDLDRVFIFRDSRKSYFVFQNKEYNEETIQDSLRTIVHMVDSIEPNVKVINLLDRCKWNEHVIETKPLKIRKEKLEVRCFTCN